MPRHPRYPLAGALLAAVLLVLVYLTAFHTSLGLRVDSATLGGFAGLSRPSIDPVAQAVAELANPQPFVVALLALVGIALLRRRPRVALAVGVALLGANATTQLLKPALAAPRESFGPTAHFISPAAWPSGHATASMTLALGAVLVASRRWRPLVAALGAAFAIAVSYSFLALQWHYPSDVLGGFLVASVWVGLGVAGVFALERRGRVKAPERGATPVWQALAPVAVLLLAGLVLGGLIAFARPEAVLSYAREHTIFLVGAATIGALGLSLSAGLSVALRR